MIFVASIRFTLGKKVSSQTTALTNNVERELCPAKVKGKQDAIGGDAGKSAGHNVAEHFELEGGLVAARLECAHDAIFEDEVDFLRVDTSNHLCHVPPPKGLETFSSHYSFIGVFKANERLIQSTLQ